MGSKKPPGKSKTTKAVPQKKASTNNRRKFVYAALVAGILILTAVIYSNALKGDILNFDDVEYFNNYPEVRNLSWDNTIKYFSEYYVIMYQPLPVLSFAISYHYSRLDVFPLHLVNLLMHMINIVLVFIFIRLLSDRREVAALAALLFAIHPINAEAVTWISARSSSMYTLFYLASLILYVRYLKVGARKTGMLLISLLFFLLSLFSKAQAVTLPVIMILLDYYLRGRFEKRLLLLKIPFLILSLIFGIITISDKGTMGNITDGMMVSYTFFDGFFLICYSFLFYFYRLFSPSDLCAVYVYPPKTDGLLPWEYYASPFALLILGVLFFLAIRKQRYVMFGLFLFLITISLNIQVIPSRLFIVTDRYAYFPYIGLYFIAAMYISDLFRRKTGFSVKARPVAIVLMLACTVYFSAATYARNKIWSNDIIFMTDIIEKNPEVPYISRAYGNRGHAWALRDNYTNAINDFTKALQISPGNSQTYYNRALMYMKTLRYNDAIADFDSAAAIDPSIAIIYSNRSVAKFNLQDYAGAAGDCTVALGIDSTLAEAYNIRGASRFFLKDPMGAESDFNAALKFKPDFAEAIRNRGTLYIKTNRPDQACADWNKAMTMGDKMAESFFNENCNK